MHTSSDSGSLAVEMLSSAYGRGTPCKQEIVREKKGHLAELHTSQGRNHISCH